jgi:hypothetical protein
MKSWQKLALSALLLALPLLAVPNQVESACANDTYCAHYTDDTFSQLCGETNFCINCSTTNTRWGCWSQYRWCETFGACGAPPRCVLCFDGTCISHPCPSGP